MYGKNPGNIIEKIAFYYIEQLNLIHLVSKYIFCERTITAYLKKRDFIFQLPNKKFHSTLEFCSYL
jgi:hypothetical protein